MDLVLDSLNEICSHGRFADTAEFIQHGKTSCQLHTIAVAYYSRAVARRLHIPCNERSLVRGALLHDYFLYDWHKKDTYEGLHGFTHPGVALYNACADFDLSDREKNIIKRHMFPLTPVPPVTTEGWIVCLVDKCCSIYEVFAWKPYYKLLKYLKRNCAVPGVKTCR